ncbi:hypothetical protein [Leptospira licerasiae]|uniref:hypothetical protein n=1 Tax=Leptospira licerasiae TaxID=447106 RepID=UPI0010824D28|nr:hypothetical protein [Leptospira licerasiae]TGM88512.1 hypothetical protein EHR05_13620 [Leptospira licerasiae]
MFNKPPGRSLPLKLALLSKNSKSLCKLSKKYQISKVSISNVIRGKRTSTRVNSLLLIEWEISVADARDVYQEHKEREALGKPVTFEEAFEWMVRKRYDYRTKFKGLEASWEEFRKSQYDLVYPIYRAAYAPRFAA